MASPSTASDSSTAAEAAPRVFGAARRRVRLSEVWTSRNVMWILAVRDIKIKYKQSALGPLWLLLQPLGMLIAVSVAFSAVTNVDTGDVPYALFALVGLSVWTFVQLIMSASTTAVQSNSALVTRSACPRIAFMDAALVSNLLPFAVLLGVTLVGIVVARGLPPQALLLPVLLAWLLLFAWGLVLIIGSIAARFRDAISLVPLLTQAGIFVSPVGYPVSAAGDFAWVLALNPLSGLIEAWRWCLLDTRLEPAMIGIALAWTVALAAIGWRVFTRMETKFADYV